MSIFTSYLNLFLAILMKVMSRAKKFQTNSRRVKMEAPIQRPRMPPTDPRRSVKPWG